MEDILFYGGTFGYIFLAGLFQFFISKSEWHTAKKFLFSIGLFLLMLAIHIFILYAPFMTDKQGEDTAGAGFAIAFLFMWILGLSIYAGVAQIITAFVVWLIKRDRKKKEINGGIYSDKNKRR